MELRLKNDVAAGGQDLDKADKGLEFEKSIVYGQRLKI